MVIEMVVSLLLILLIIGGYFFIKAGKPDKIKNERQVKQQVPTLFIPGYMGNRFSFGRLMRRFHKYYGANKSIVAIVNKDNSVDMRGEIDAYRPMVQILFRNKNSRADLQAAGLRNVCQQLYASYQVEEVNLVAHSMGCITEFWFLTHFLNETSLKVKNVVAMGGPFNDSEVARTTRKIESHYLTKKGPIYRNKIYKELEKKIDNIPENIRILNIAGNIGDDVKSDGAVSLSSALSLKYLLINSSKRYSELVITGREGKHSLLHENSRVDHKIARFIW